MDDVVALLTAFGLGSIVTSFVQAWLSLRAQQNERRFKEKQGAYVGLLEAYHRAATERTEEAAMAFAYWQMRCELVGSNNVRDAVRRIVESNDDRAARQKADYDLKSAMRKDLQITN